MTLQMPDVSARLSERPDERYAMIASREASCDRGFFYGVRTTRVFCRPGCRSRLPLPHNVVSFASAAQARTAGYRACKRCRPESASGGAARVEVAYAVVGSALGAVLVAATERGICSVRLGSDARDLEYEIHAEFPDARIARHDRLESVTSAVVRYLAGDGPWPQLPLDVRATAFAARVWDALRRIAPGTTVTYSELARALGDERSTRAVARAVASNPIALLIPCHRVLRKGGGLGGYRWGIERKRALLDLERAREKAER